MQYMILEDLCRIHIYAESGIGGYWKLEMIEDVGRRTGIKRD